MDKSEKDAVKQLREFEVTCPNCKKSSPLSRWGFVQTYWYQPPYGPCHMMGGDYEIYKDINQCLLVCPNNCYVDEKKVQQNLATRIMDLPIPRVEREQVFGTIKLITNLSESNLVRIFDGYYVQYGQGKEIKSSEELREERESEMDLY